MYFSKILLLIILAKVLDHGQCYSSMNDEEKSDINKQLFFKDGEKYLSKNSQRQKFLILRTSGHQNLIENQNIYGNSIKKMNKQNLIELNRLLSMLKKNRNPSKEDLEKYRNLQRIIFSYGR
jgi:hypothetical protein